MRSPIFSGVLRAVAGGSGALWPDRSVPVQWGGGRSGREVRCLKASDLWVRTTVR